MKVMSRCGKLDCPKLAVVCRLATTQAKAMAAAMAARLIIFLSSRFDVCYNKHCRPVKAAGFASCPALT